MINGLFNRITEESQWEMLVVMGACQKTQSSCYNSILTDLWSCRVITE